MLFNHPKGKQNKDLIAQVGFIYEQETKLKDVAKFRVGNNNRGNSVLRLATHLWI